MSPEQRMDGVTASELELQSENCVFEARNPPPRDEEIETPTPAKQVASRGDVTQNNSTLEEIRRVM